MTASQLVDRLASHRTLAGVPVEQLEWLASHGRVRQFAAGDIVFHSNEQIPELYVVLAGLLTYSENRGSGPRKVAEWRGGDVTGLLPFSRMSVPLGDVVAEEPSEALTLHLDHFPQMIRDSPELTAVLVHEMVDRARFFSSDALREKLRDEKMRSLGRLAAGLAHELNNPASAVARSAKSLAGELGDLDAASRALGAGGLSEPQLAVVNRFSDRGPAAATMQAWSPLELGDREEAIAEWLDRHRLDHVDAGSLADAALTPAALDELAAALDGRTLPLALMYLAAACSVRKLTAEIEAAATKIHGLVTAVKGFTYMDQAVVPGLVDIGRGLLDTLTVLHGKARAKGAELRHAIDPGLPAVEGFGGELNQVWANLIDNALDAVSKAGHVTVTAAREQQSIVVRVIDDGPGISEENRERIFDPFFTTKLPGEGTGLGLDIAHGVIARHKGTIAVDSKPGRTEFRVTLPIEAAGHGGAA